MVGVKEHNYNPPPHKCPRWDIEILALRRVASVAEAFLDKQNGAIKESHLRMVLDYLHEAEKKCERLEQQSKP